MVSIAGNSKRLPHSCHPKINLYYAPLFHIKCYFITVKSCPCLCKHIFRNWFLWMQEFIRGNWNRNIGRRRKIVYDMLIDSFFKHLHRQYLLKCLWYSSHLWLVWHTIRNASVHGYRIWHREGFDDDYQNNDCLWCCNGHYPTYCPQYVLKYPSSSQLFYNLIAEAAVITSWQNDWFWLGMKITPVTEYRN